MRRWIPLVLIAATVVFSAVVYTRLPDPMVIHWNAAGEPGGYGSRLFGTFLLPVVTLFIWGMMVVVPRIDPRRSNIELFRGTYGILVIAVTGVTGLLLVAILGSALGWPLQVGWIPGRGARLLCSEHYSRGSAPFIGIRPTWP